MLLLQFHFLIFGLLNFTNQYNIDCNEKNYCNKISKKKYLVEVLHESIYIIF